MIEKENKVSTQEASDSLKQIANSQTNIVEHNRPPLLILLAISISYAFIVFGYGMTEHENLWALAMIIGGFGFAVSFGLYLYTYRLLGIKIHIIPKSNQSIKMNILLGLAFAALVIASREIRLLGFDYASYIASFAAGLLMFITLYKYPTGEYINKDTNNE